MATEVEETVKRIQAQKGVAGVIVTTHEGNPIHSTLDAPTTTRYATVVSGLADSAKAAVRELDAANDLTFLRLRTKRHELMIAPDKNYMLIVVQNIGTE
ncbi:dynein light chain roadblock-type 1-like [Tropilaelaps mercedesae]|uniref:Dynein light chain roadblock n=1 Tax=Tropilaelaps mercedesae TaxID=418985 RepID=A0A1V9XMR4_9ACAR|nr:dynein light chain roadblock-type 1-like [Tropilaelaps mercedesae]